MKNIMKVGTVQEDLKRSSIQSESDGLGFPFTLEDICSKFVVESSNKKSVKEIGLLGSNGIPSFVSSASPYLNEPALKLAYLQSDARCHAFGKRADEQLGFSLDNKTISGGERGNPTINPPEFSVKDMGDMLKAAMLALENSKPKDENSLSHNSAQVDVKPGCTIPEPSLRPLIGNAYQILRRLKNNLFDMETALPEAALRPSKVGMERRWAWHDYVKAARTIYEMVQALIVLEDSIKPEYLSNTWFYWSSLSAAAQISTLSALALHLYSLDAAIKYKKSSSKQLDAKVQNPKEQSSRDSTEKGNKGRKLKKKRKEMAA